MGNGLVPCRSWLASSAAASIDDERVWADTGEENKALYELPLTKPVQATLPAVEKTFDDPKDVSADQGFVPAASEAVAVSAPAPEPANAPLRFPTLAPAAAEDATSASTTVPEGGAASLTKEMATPAEAAKDVPAPAKAVKNAPAKAAKVTTAADLQAAKDSATLSAEEKELTTLLRSTVMREEDGAAEVIRGKLKEIRAHPNYKGRLAQAEAKARAANIVKATPKKKAAPDDEEAMPEFKIPCEKTQEEMDLELKQIKKKFGPKEVDPFDPDQFLSGMKLAKAQAAKDEAAKKKKADSSAASTSSKGSSQPKRKKKLEAWEKIPKWDPMDGRDVRKMMFVSYYREQYARLKQEGKELKVATQYDPTLKTGLTITGGHQPFSVPPADVDLPKDFRLNIGTMKKKDLSKYNCESQRMLVSVHGDLFDVSDRPDKYGADGPYWEMTGKDITWGLTCGDDSAPNYDKYYDVFKIHPDTVDGKLQGLCSWWAFYEKEYGEPVGKLDVYIDDWKLPAPPPIEESCSVM